MKSFSSARKRQGRVITGELRTLPTFSPVVFVSVVKKQREWQVEKTNCGESVQRKVQPNIVSRPHLYGFFGSPVSKTTRIHLHFFFLNKEMEIWDTPSLPPPHDFCPLRVRDVLGSDKSKRETKKWRRGGNRKVLEKKKMK